VSRGAKRALERAGFALMLGLVRPLPRPAAMRVGSFLGWLAFDVARVRRKVAVANVRERLAPAGGRSEAVRIARESYRVMARTFLDLVRADRLDDASLWRALRREEFEAFRRIEREERGAVLVSGHFGNWELLVLGIRRMGLAVHAMAADQANRAVDAYVKEARARAGVPTLSARRGVRAAYDALRAGGYVATLMDQDARRRGIFVEFLGAPASTHTGVVAMAMRAGRPLMPGVLVDLGGGRSYRLVRGEIWRPDPALPEDANLRAAATHFHRFLEAQVREHPGNYLWAHRRWKTRPPEGAGAAAEPAAGPGPAGAAGGPAARPAGADAG
jgi:KDO2-lipid IV(A) lauroyltransferase